MEDFKFLVYDRFPELKKCLQRLMNLVSIMDTYVKQDDMFLVLDLFEIMLRNSIECDKLEEIPVSAFTEMYFYIIQKYFRVKKGEEPKIEFLESSFELLFETLVKLCKFTPEYCIKFLADITIASNYRTANFLYFLSKSNVKLILDNFVKQRSHPWDIDDYWLTNFLVCEDEHHFCENLFIRYGFKYIFNDEYLDQLHVEFMVGMWVDDVHFCHYIDEEMLYDTFETLLRVQLAIELLVALFVNEKIRNAISLLWKSIPYTFITANELYNLLHPCVLERYDLLKSLCDQYQKTVNAICPVPKVPEPRSLKHLSRVQVRNRLFEVHNLNEETIGELDIPVTVKDYLWLDDF